MKIPIHIPPKQKTAVEFFDFVKEIEAKYGFNIRDMASRNSPESNVNEHQDVWHWLIDNDFCDMHNGSYHYLNLTEERMSGTEEGWDPLPDYVRVVLEAMREELKDHEVFDGGEVRFYVSW